MDAMFCLHGGCIGLVSGPVTEEHAPAVVMAPAAPLLLGVYRLPFRRHQCVERGDRHRFRTQSQELRSVGTPVIHVFGGAEPGIQ